MTTNQPAPEMVEQAKANLAREQALRAEGKGKSKRKAKAQAATPPKVTTYRTSARAKGDFSNEDVLTLEKAPAERPKLRERYDLITDGMTVAQALAVQKGLHGRRSAIRALIEGGFVTRRPAKTN